MKKSKNELVIRDGGGIFNRVFAETLYRPFETATGVSVRGVESASEPTELIKDMVRSGEPEWDLSLLSKQSQSTLAAQDCLETIGPPGPVQKQIPEEMRDEYMSGLLIYASVLAYRTDRRDAPAPASWRDFWDLQAYPGRRAMRCHAFDTFEQALLADGVAPDSLYPLDVGRALRSLDRIRDHVSFWWKAGGRSTELLRDGQVDLACVWSGRAHAAAAAGAPVSWTWHQGLWTHEGFAILKGTKSLQLCRELIEFCADAKRQAVCASRLHYGPVNPGAFEYIDPDMAGTLPTNPDHFDKLIRIDSGFWSEIKSEAMQRFENWRAGEDASS